MKKLVHLATLGVIAVFGVGISVGCATTKTSEPSYAVAEYEDCDTEDQYNREDDCGYWNYNGLFYVGALPGPGALWYYWSWVVPGQTSWAPIGWKAPYNLKAPVASVKTKQRYKDFQRKQHEAGKPVTGGNATKATNSGSGNQGVPRNTSTKKSDTTSTGSKPRTGKRP